MERELGFTSEREKLERVKNQRESGTIVFYRTSDIFHIYKNVRLMPFFMKRIQLTFSFSLKTCVKPKSCWPVTVRTVNKPREVSISVVTT